MHHAITRSIGAAIVAGLALTGCSSGGGGAASSDGLDVYLNMPSGSAQVAVMEDLAKSFTEETGTKVNLTFESTNFENNLKVRMASGNLPDVWSTHGWSVLRYGQFLEPLNGQPWEQYVNKGLDNSMRDAEGNLYALPIEYTVTGFVANLDVLKEAGVDADSITTMDGFTAALAKVKAAGKIPVVSAGKENGPAGDLANFIASGAFSEAELTATKAGTFDKAGYQKLVLDPIEDWATKDYFNPDYVSAAFEDMAQQLAQGNAAFGATQPTLMTAALEINPDANIGFIPFVAENNEPYLVGGEGVNAYGVWKDSTRKEEALKFLDYLAKPANAQKLAQAIGTYSGLTNVDVDLGSLQPTYDKWVTPGELPTLPFYDRVYLPNGMWSTIVTTTDAVISKQSSAADAANQMDAQFTTLFGQQS